MLVSGQDLEGEEHSLTTLRIFEEYLNQCRSEGPFKTILLSVTDAEYYKRTVTLRQHQFSWLIEEKDHSGHFMKIRFDIEGGERFLSSADRYEILKRVFKPGFFSVVARVVSEHLKVHSSVHVK